MSIWGQIWQVDEKRATPADRVLMAVENAANAYHNGNEWTANRVDGSDGHPDSEHPSYLDLIEKAARDSDLEFANLRAELEAMRERAETAEARIAGISGVTRERLAEVKFKEGYDKGFADGKKADPPPKAKRYRDEAIEARGQFANLRARVNVVVMRLAHADGDAHVPCDREPAVVEALADLREALVESER